MENELVRRLHKGHLGLNPCLTFLTHPFAVPSRLLGPKRIVGCTVPLVKAARWRVQMSWLLRLALLFPCLSRNPFSSPTEIPPGPSILTPATDRPTASHIPHSFFGHTQIYRLITRIAIAHSKLQPFKTLFIVGNLKKIKVLYYD